MRSWLISTLLGMSCALSAWQAMANPCARSLEHVPIKNIALFPLDTGQITASAEAWNALIEDLKRIDFDTPNPTLMLTQYLQRGAPSATLQLPTPLQFTVLPELIEGWKTLGFIIDGRFELPEPAQIIERFNSVSNMEAFVPQLKVASETILYSHQLTQGRVPLVDIHDYVFHLPILSIKNSRDSIRFMAFELAHTQTDIGYSSLNVIFEQGMKAKNGVFTAQLILTLSGTQWDFSDDNTFENFLTQCDAFIQRLGHNLNLTEMYPHYSVFAVMTDAQTMWFTGLLASHLKLLDLLASDYSSRYGLSNPSEKLVVRAELKTNLARLKAFEKLIPNYPKDLIDKLETL